MEREGKKTQQALRQQKTNILSFINTVLFKALWEKIFHEHLRKAWNQCQITKRPIVIKSIDPNSVAIRTREDYQEDIKFLCMSETVSTHRGVGVITMVCNPIVMEIFFDDGTKQLIGIIYLSNVKNKNFNTVRHFEEKCIEYVKQQLGYKIRRYDRLTDGCSSQYWCYGSFHHLETMPTDLDIPNIKFHRYEPYEGKNFSDALGSILKQKMRSEALQNKVFGNNEESMQQILDEIDDDTELDDLVFGSEQNAFELLQMCMDKSDEDNFSNSFKRNEMFWIPLEETPVNVVHEKECRKVPKVKSYNMAMATIDTLGVYVRDSYCYDCENCLQGNVMSCTSQKNGKWLHHIVQKNIYITQKIGNTVENDEGDETDEEEFTYDSEEDDVYANKSDDDDEEDEMEDVPNVLDLCLGRYVLYKYMEKKFYVGYVIGQSEKDEICHITKREDHFRLASD